MADKLHNFRNFPHQSDILNHLQKCTLLFGFYRLRINFFHLNASNCFSDLFYEILSGINNCIQPPIHCYKICNYRNFMKFATDEILRSCRMIISFVLFYAFRGVFQIEFQFNLGNPLQQRIGHRYFTVPINLADRFTYLITNKGASNIRNV